MVATHSMRMFNTGRMMFVHKKKRKRSSTAAVGEEVTLRSIASKIKFLISRFRAAECSQQVLMVTLATHFKQGKINNLRLQGYPTQETTNSSPLITLGSQV